MPDKQDEMMKGMWTGCSLKQVSATKRWLPEIYSQTEKWYQLDVLLQSEKEMKKVVVKDIKPICDETGQPSYEEAMEKTFVQNQTRDSWLLELSDYEVLSGDSVKVGNFWTNRNAQMNAPFEVRTLGYRGISYES